MSHTKKGPGRHHKQGKGRKVLNNNGIRVKRKWRVTCP